MLSVVYSGARCVRESVATASRGLALIGCRVAGAWRSGRRASAAYRLLYLGTGANLLIADKRAMGS